MKSDRRDKETATPQPSAHRISRQAPPTEIPPFALAPVNAAR
jgi:hypothetical protein